MNILLTIEPHPSWAEVRLDVVPRGHNTYDQAQLGFCQIAERLRRPGSDFTGCRTEQGALGAPISSISRP